MKKIACITILCLAIFYPGLYLAFAPQELQWQEVVESTTPRFEGPGVAVDDKLYLFFGYVDYIEKDHLLVATNDVSSYDPDSDSWTRRNPAPFRGTHVNGVYDGKFVWFAGGFAGNHPGPGVTSVWKYQPATDTWASGPDLPAARGGGALVLIQQELHYISGYYAALEEPSSENHWVLDLDHQEAGWRDEPALPVSRGHAAGVAIGNAIYIIGGSLTHHPTWIDTDRVDRYNIDNDSWEQVASLPYPASHFEPGSYIENGNIIIAGGRNGDSAILSEYELQDILVYQPQNDKWLLAGALPKPLRAPVVRKINGRIIVSTGSTNWAQEPSSKTYIYDCADSRALLCGGNNATTVSSVKLWLKSTYKRLAVVLPWKLQSLLHLKQVAGID